MTQANDPFGLQTGSEFVFCDGEERPAALDAGGLLRPGTKTVLSGHAGAGKTLHALRLALDCASRGANVLYLAGEAHADMRGWIPRLWCGLGRAEAELHDTILRQRLFVTSTSRRLTAAEFGKAVLGSLADMAVATGKRSEPAERLPPTLVVVDPLACFLAGDENDTRDMRAFLDALDVFAVRAFGATALLLHHLSREGRLRGSTVLDAAADTILRLDELRDGVRRLTWLKGRQGMKPPQHYAMRFEEHAITFDLDVKPPTRVLARGNGHAP